MSRIYFTITGTSQHYGQEFFEPKMSVRLVKVKSYIWCKLPQA